MMSDEQGLLLRVLCLVAGYVFGCFPCADVAARCVAGAPLRFVGDGSSRTSNIRRYLGKTAVAGVVTGNVLKTWLSCWFCYKLAAPELEYAAMLYAGFGVLLGHSWPLVGSHRGGQGGGRRVCRGGDQPGDLFAAAAAQHGGLVLHGGGHGVHHGHVLPGVHAAAQDRQTFQVLLPHPQQPGRGGAQLRHAGAGGQFDGFDLQQGKRSFLRGVLIRSIIPQLSAGENRLSLFSVFPMFKVSLKTFQTFLSCRFYTVAKG